MLGARARGQDRAALVRDLLSSALRRDLEEHVVAAYAAGQLSLSQAAARLGVDPWSFLDVLRRHGAALNY
jgi:predicted HTH domain antitoxin